MYLNLETKEILQDSVALRVALRHISLPLALKDETLRKFGYTILHEGDKPVPSVCELVEEEGIEERADGWYRVWRLVSKPFEDVVSQHHRIIEIKGELKVLDDRSIRPLRTLVMRKGGEEDYNILLKIEKERDDLMTEMNNIIEAIGLATRG